VSGRLIDNVLGYRSLRTFLERHIRWCRLRRRISLPGYIGEFLVNPTALALIALAVVPTGPMAVVAGSIWMCASGIAWSAERKAGVRRSLIAYPPLELLRGILTAVVWFVPFFSSTVSWRGDKLKIGPRTRLEKISIPSS